MDELNDRERHWIATIDTICPNGYNIEEGGNQIRMSEATKAKFRGESGRKKLGGS